MPLYDISCSFVRCYIYQYDLLSCLLDVIREPLGLAAEVSFWNKWDYSVLAGVLALRCPYYWIDCEPWDEDLDSNYNHKFSFHVYGDSFNNGIAVLELLSYFTFVIKVSIMQGPIPAWQWFLQRCQSWLPMSYFCIRLTTNVSMTGNIHHQGFSLL